MSDGDVEKYSTSHRCCRTAAKASLNVACCLAYQALFRTREAPKSVGQSGSARVKALPLKLACRTAFNSCGGAGVGVNTRAELKISHAFWCSRAGKPETFNFLGFTHYCATTRRGRFRLGRKPVAKRVNRTLARIDEVLRKRWHHDIWEVGMWLGRVYQGWLNYFAVPGSGRFIRSFHRRLQRLWMRALRRRSQRAHFDWKRLERMTEILWPRASICHPWPDQRFAVNHPR